MSVGGIVVTPHSLASEVGRAIVADGGDAISAAIAINAVLTVVCPHFCGLGGDAVWMVSNGHGLESCLLGIGQGVAHAPRQEYNIPTRGPQSILTTAGVVDCWDAAQNYATSIWGDSRCLSDLLSPAIGLAETGHLVSHSMAYWLRYRGAETSEWPGFSTLFEPHGRQLTPGDIFKQPELASSLRSLAKNGARSFYEGTLSKQILQGLRNVGVHITASDLKRTATRKVDPLRLAYRDVEFLSPPPPTQGLTTLQIMGILERFDLSQISEGSVEHFHLVVEAVKQAFLDRGKITDPNYSVADLDSMLRVETLNKKAALVTDTAMRWVKPLKSADTVYFGVVDRQGRCVSALQSTYFDWGSGVAVGDTGILWHNRGAAFDTNPEHPNGFMPNKLPFFTLNPGIALQNGKPALLYGTQGADGQPQTLALLLTRLIDYGQSPSKALHSARFLLGRTFSDSNDTLKVEDSVPDKFFTELSIRGHEVTRIPALSPLVGQAGVIKINADGALDGAHDPRGEGCAMHC